MALPGGNKLMIGCSASGGAYASQDSLAGAGLTSGVPASVTFSAKAYRTTTAANGEQTYVRRRHCPLAPTRSASGRGAV